MKLNKYLKEKIPDILIIASVMIFTGYLLGLLSVDSYAVIFIEGLFSIVFTFIFLKSYIKRNIFFRELKNNLRLIDKKYLLADMLERPGFLEGDILYDTIKECLKSMNDEIAGYRIWQKEYKEYVEMWIHEVKTPITAAELIINNNRNKVTDNIDNELQRINYYLEQTLFYARSGNVEKDYIIKKTDLKEIINNVIRKNSKLFIRERIKLEIENVEFSVFTDVKWLEFILNQIITNAIKYKKENCIIRISGVEGKNSKIIHIRDNGIGINAKDLQRVKEKGYTGETGRKYSKSTGIGLYLCDNLCRKMGLSFNIKSEEGIYTEVEIVFPERRLLD